MATKIPMDTDFWSNKITWYVLKHKISYNKFTILCGISHQELYNIINLRTQKVTTKTLGKLLEVLDTEEPPCYN